jgi:hypothetical protein
MNGLKRNLTPLMSFALMAGLALANPAYADDPLSFTYTNAADGNLVANFTIDVVGGYAVSGTGTVTSSFLTGTNTLNLVTYQTVLPAGDGSINVTNSPVTNGFTWHGVAGSGGADFLADNVVLTPSPLYLDEYGLLFSITDASDTMVGGLNIFDQGPPDGVGYSDNFAANGTLKSYAGTGSLTLNVSPVPEPGTYLMLLCGLGLMGFVVRRRKQGFGFAAA